MFLFFGVTYRNYVLWRDLIFSGLAKTRWGSRFVIKSGHSGKATDEAPTSNAEYDKSAESGKEVEMHSQSSMESKASV